VKVDVHEEDGIPENDGQRQERDAKERIADASRVSKSLRDALVGGGLIRLDRTLKIVWVKTYKRAPQKRATAIRDVAPLLQE
jgi:hypothetical protein